MTDSSCALGRGAVPLVLEACPARFCVCLHRMVSAQRSPDSRGLPLLRAVLLPLELISAASAGLQNVSLSAYSKTSWPPGVFKVVWHFGTL